MFERPLTKSDVMFIYFGSKCIRPASVTCFAYEISKNSKVLSRFAMKLNTLLSTPYLHPES